MQQFLKFYYLTFMYSWNCFGRPYAHHQELNICSRSLWFYRWSVVVAVLLVVVGPTTTNRDGYSPCTTANVKSKMLSKCWLLTLASV